MQRASAVGGLVACSVHQVRAERVHPDLEQPAALQRALVDQLRAAGQGVVYFGNFAARTSTFSIVGRADNSSAALAISAAAMGPDSRMLGAESVMLAR